MGRTELNKDKAEASKEYLKRYLTKTEEKYKKADRERKQYERSRMKYLEPKKSQNHNKIERNQIRTYRQKNKFKHMRIKTK